MVNQTKISIIGAGSVGAAIAYALMFKKVAAEMLLVDIDTARRDGEVLDMSDGAFYTGTKVKAGSYQEAGQTDIVVITAGVKQREGETRLQLLDRNRRILTSVIDSMKPLNPNLIIILVTNPCDIMTTFAQRVSGLPRSQVFGSGTFLDTQRLRKAVADRIQVSETAVHAYIIGEHGDSQVAAFSSATVGGMPLLDFPVEPRLTIDELSTMADQAKNKAYAIIKAKGATYFGIASVVASICESIVFNQQTIRPVSCYIDKYQTYVSMPCVLGSKGIERILELPLSDEEKAAFESSATKLRELSADTN
eukprot:TRINITY_DN1454_c0_g1_i1.p2 TRINITY_DN1454_c0_g1~~TRINITY_DN1454_c0_g1_i1.p2  ORF type:complete len:307 (+),score=128.05 TRINITY_DN1454_c0_g1_i1:122-1042(+)